VYSIYFTLYAIEKNINTLIVIVDISVVSLGTIGCGSAIGHFWADHTRSA
jgi:hypothetical protein